MVQAEVQACLASSLRSLMISSRAFESSAIGCVEVPGVIGSAMFNIAPVPAQPAFLPGPATARSPY